jgi:hypothetical protein
LNNTTILRAKPQVATGQTSASRRRGLGASPWILLFSSITRTTNLDRDFATFSGTPYFRRTAAISPLLLGFDLRIRQTPSNTSLCLPHPSPGSIAETPHPNLAIADLDIPTLPLTKHSDIMSTSSFNPTVAPFVPRPAPVSDSFLNPEAKVFVRGRRVHLMASPLQPNGIPFDPTQPAASTHHLNPQQSKFQSRGDAATYVPGVAFIEDSEMGEAPAAAQEVETVAAGHLADARASLCRSSGRSVEVGHAAQSPKIDVPQPLTTRPSDECDMQSHLMEMQDLDDDWVHHINWLGKAGLTRMRLLLPSRCVPFCLLRRKSIQTRRSPRVSSFSCATFSTSLTRCSSKVT